jgi:hypothetical protein
MVKICGWWLKAVSNTILPFVPGEHSLRGTYDPDEPRHGQTSYCHGKHAAHGDPLRPGSPAFSPPAWSDPTACQGAGQYFRQRRYLQLRGELAE